MVQNEINNMSFLTADNKSKMAKVGALLWEVALAGREGTPKGFLPAPPPRADCPVLVTFPAALTALSSLLLHFLPPILIIPGPPPLSPYTSQNCPLQGSIQRTNPPTLSQGVGMPTNGCMSRGQRGWVGPTWN